MCGIVGVLGARPAAPLLLDALRRLEYRGYDSAGIATRGERPYRHRPLARPAKLQNLAAVLDQSPLAGATRRSATPAGPRMAHATENQRAPAHGHPPASPWCITASSKTTPPCAPSWKRPGRCSRPKPDTETVAQLLDLKLQQGLAPVEAARATLARLEGRLRAGDRVRRASRAAGGRAARRAAGGRLRRGRDVPRLRQSRLGAADPAHRLPARRRLRRADPGRARNSLTPRATRCSARCAVRCIPARRSGKDGFRRLHGKGAARAPQRHRPGAATHDRPGEPHRGARPRLAV